jgi:hypothetical protein
MSVTVENPEVRAKRTSQGDSLFEQWNAYAADGLSSWTEAASAAHQIVGEVINFTAAAVKEHGRLYTEVQTVFTTTATRTLEMLNQRPTSPQDVTNPFSWCALALLDSIRVAQVASKLVEQNALPIVQSGERLQWAAQQAAHEIQQKLTVLGDRLTATVPNR